MSHLREEELWALAAGDVAQDGPEAAHASGCLPCRARLQELSLVRGMARKARVSEPSPNARAQAVARFDEAMRAEEQQRRFWMERRPMLGPALGLSALAGAALALLLDGSRELPAWAPPESAGTHTAARAPTVDIPPIPDTVAVRPPMVVHGTSTVQPLAPKVAALPVKKGKQPIAAPLPSVVEEMAPVEPAMPQVSGVEVVMVPRFPRVEAARALLGQGQSLRAAQAGVSLLASSVVEERDAAVDVVRGACLQQPSDALLGEVDAAVESYPAYGEQLQYLACETSMLGRQWPEAVRRCRSFALSYPRSNRSREASYYAGTVAREELHDCLAAVGDYSRALVFAGPLGSLNDEALFWRASCQAELGHDEDARADLAQFLSRYPARKVDPKVRGLQQQLESVNAP